MTHLRIELNSNNEAVSSTLVHRLYTEAHAGLDSTSNLAGMITVPHCKLSEKNYLENLYPGLTINCAEGYYMDFVDPEVERICATNWGDGVGITQTQAVAATGVVWNEFCNNTLITSFDELKYFNFNYFGWGWGLPSGFCGCTNLQSVDYGGKSFGLSRGLFSGASATRLRRGFCGVNLPNLIIIKLPSTISEIAGLCINNVPSLKALVLNSLVPPTPFLDSGATFNGFDTSEFPLLKIYVPDSAVNDYKSATGWSNNASIIYSHSQYAIDWPND